MGESIALSPDGKRVAYTTYEDGKLTLVISDLVAKTRRVATLLEDSSTSKPASRLKTLKWLSPRRLLIQTEEGDLFACDENGLNATRLWDKRDNGLVQTQFFPNSPPAGYMVNPDVPRLMGASPDEPETVFVESVAKIGAEVFSNLYRVDVGRGVTTIANDKLYLDFQMALYGRGDMILWPPTPRIEGDSIPGSGGGVRSVGGANLSKDTREMIRFKAHSSLDPMMGGAVGIHSSESGRMLYDRNGAPHILYVERGIETVHPFLVTQGREVFVPDIPPPTLDEWLGQPKAADFAVSTANYFGERSMPVAFDYDPDVLYFASNKGRDTYALYRLNLLTKSRDPAPVATAPYDLSGFEPDFEKSNLVFDDRRKKVAGVRVTAVRPVTIWFDEDLRDLQVSLDRALPRHTVELVDWDAAREKILVRATAEDDPGAYFIFDRATGTLDEFLSRAPGLKAEDVSPSTSFSFVTPAGVSLSGYLTLPNKPKANPPPLMIYLQGGLWDRADPGFNRESQMLANMGVAVVRLNYRGTAGFGRKHMMAIADGIDSVPLEDMIATVDWMATRYKFDRKRTLVMGEGFGGYLALRAMQLRPDIFKCAISLNAPTSLSAWASEHPVMDVFPMYWDGSEELRQVYDFASMTRSLFISKSKRGADQPEVTGDFKRPVLVIENPHSGDITPWASLVSSMGLNFTGTSMERLSISGPFEYGSADTRRRVFQRIDEFLNINLYEYGTEIRNLRPNQK